VAGKSEEFTPSDDPEIRSFVLRVRLTPGGEHGRLLVHLDDVAAARNWHFTSLEDAFAEIREALQLLGDTSGSPGKPH